MIYVIDHKDSFTHNVVHQLSLFDDVECDDFSKINKSKLKQKELEEKLITISSQIPNLPDSSVPSGNSAEVDFLIQYNNEIIPIEVKSDENIKSRSLQVFNQKYQPKLRIRYSLKNLSYQEGLLNIPHFMSDYTKELVDIILAGNNS